MMLLYELRMVKDGQVRFGSGTYANLTKATDEAIAHKEKFPKEAVYVVRSEENWCAHVVDNNGKWELNFG